MRQNNYQERGFESLCRLNQHSRFRKGYACLECPENQRNARNARASLEPVACADLLGWATDISHQAVAENASRFVAMGADRCLNAPCDGDIGDLVDQEKAL